MYPFLRCFEEHHNVWRFHQYFPLICAPLVFTYNTLHYVFISSIYNNCCLLFTTILCTITLEIQSLKYFSRKKWDAFEDVSGGGPEFAGTVKPIPCILLFPVGTGTYLVNWFKYSQCWPGHQQVGNVFSDIVSGKTKIC